MLLLLTIPCALFAALAVTALAARMAPKPALLHSSLSIPAPMIAWATPARGMAGFPETLDRRARTPDANIRLLRLRVTQGALAAVFIALGFRYGFGPGFAAIAVALAGLFTVALIDAERQVILNKLLLPLALGFLLLAPFWPHLGIQRELLGLQGPWASLVNSLLAGAGPFIFFLAINVFRSGGMGEGDVKLAGVIGLLLGFPGIVAALWLAIAGAGVMALYALAMGNMRRQDTMPFGPFLVAGAAATLLFI